MPERSRPIITLTSDFGLSDAYVATMKARFVTIQIGENRDAEPDAEP